MRIIINTFIIGLSLFSASVVHAAVLYWVPAVGEWKIGDTITADLKIDSEGTGINAAQATISFPPGLLEVSSLNKGDSAFGSKNRHTLTQRGPYHLLGEPRMEFPGRQSKCLPRPLP